MKNKRASLRFFFLSFFFIIYFPGADGRTGRAAETCRERDGADRRSDGRRTHQCIEVVSVLSAVAIGGEVREGGRSGDLQHVTPLGPPGGRKKNKKRRSTRVMKLAGCQSDRRDISGGDRSQTWRLPACQRRRHHLLLLLHPSKSSILSNESVQSVK